MPAGFLLGLLADLAQPLLPLAGLLALGFALLLALALAWRAPRQAGRAAGLFLGLAGVAGAQLAWSGPRGVLAAHLPALAASQAAALHLPPPSLPVYWLRTTLALPRVQPLPFPASADEHLFNALLLDARGDRRGAAAALVASLARDEAPRPDALLLHDALMGWPDARPILAAAAPPPAAAALLAALRLPDAATRAAALAALPAEDAPDALLVQAALAQAGIIASLPEGPTVAEAARIAPAVAAFADDGRFAAFADRFLDPRRAGQLRQGVAAFGWVREVAARRLEVATLPPPTGLPDQPILLRLLPPEPAQAVQLRQDGAWVDVPLEDQVATLRLPRPFTPRPLVLRYLDRNGLAAAEITHEFDPVGAIRAQAVRTLRRQGPFALYQPGWIAPGQINALPIAGPLRAGLNAIAWWTDLEPAPQRVAVDVPDAALLAGDAPRILVPFSPPEEARLLGLVAIFADGSRGEALTLPIR